MKLEDAKIEEREYFSKTLSAGYLRNLAKKREI